MLMFLFIAYVDCAEKACLDRSYSAFHAKSDCLWT